MKLLTKNTRLLIYIFLVLELYANKIIYCHNRNITYHYEESNENHDMLYNQLYKKRSLQNRTTLPVSFDDPNGIYNYKNTRNIKIIIIGLSPVMIVFLIFVIISIYQ
jgi:predicted restriction endonuclease